MIKIISFTFIFFVFSSFLMAQIVDTSTLPDGWHKVQIQPGVYYDGETVAGHLEGKGMMIWADSSSYSGKWKTNMRHGKGTMKWKNGTVFMGKFKNDELIKGTFIFLDGAKYYGKFQDDKFHGKGILFKKDGTVEKGVWEYGKKVN